MPKLNLIPLDELLTGVKEIAAEHEYEASRTKSPRKKRQALTAIRFWKSIEHHLTKLNELEEKKVMEVPEFYTQL